MQIKLSTTGTLNPVPIFDLGAVEITHPTVDLIIYDSSLDASEFTLEELQRSKDLQDAIDNGYITISNENELNITDLFNFLSNSNDIVAPYITNIHPIVVNVNQSKTFQVVGKNFDIYTQVQISGWDGTIDEVRVYNAEYLEFDVTSGNQISHYDLVLSNYDKKSNQWLINSGLNSIVVEDLPDGLELPLRVSDANGDKYVGTAFAKSEDNNGRRAEKAFDGNSGTRHYAEKNESQDHYLGIIMSQKTLLTKLGYNGEFGSSPFRIEGSDDTTDGSDGTWVNLGDYTLTVDTTDVEVLGFAYNAFRYVWTNADDAKWANARELILFGRQ